MNHNEDVAFSTLKLASKEDSFSRKTGALIVNGGVGCNKNIHTKGLVSDCILNNKDITIYGNLNVNIILPTGESVHSNIGDVDKRYSKIYSNNIDTNDIFVNNSVISTNIKTNYLDVNNNLSVGDTLNDICNLKIDSDDNLISMNSTLITIKNNDELSFQIDNKTTFINNLLKYKYQIVNITEDYILYPEASIIIVNISDQCSCSVNIDIQYRTSSITDETLENGTYIKIYNNSDVNNIIANNNISIISKSNADFILHENVWIPLGYGHVEQHRRVHILEPNPPNNYDDHQCEGRHRS